MIEKERLKRKCNRHAHTNNSTIQNTDSMNGSNNNKEFNNDVIELDMS
jgi:hypothetical protein